MAKFKVTLFATLPASASMMVEAESMYEAEQYAFENYEKADWKGSDSGDIPQGADVTEAHVEEQS